MNDKLGELWTLVYGFMIQQPRTQFEASFQQLQQKSPPLSGALPSFCISSVARQLIWTRMGLVRLIYLLWLARWVPVTQGGAQKHLVLHLSLLVREHLGGSW